MNIKSDYLTQSYERKNTISEQHSQQKPFEKLNLTDSFLFESATENTKNAIIISRVIIEHVTGKKVGNLVVHLQKELLNFMEDSIRDNAVDNELVEIMDIVDTVKSDSEEHKRYMGIMNVIDYEKRASYEDGPSNGLQEGIERSIHGVIQTCKSFGANREKAKEEIIKQFSISETDSTEYVVLYWDKEPATTHE